MYPVYIENKYNKYVMHKLFFRIICNRIRLGIAQSSFWDPKPDLTLFII